MVLIEQHGRDPGHRICLLCGRGPVSIGRSTFQDKTGYFHGKCILKAQKKEREELKRKSWQPL